MEGTGPETCGIPFLVRLETARRQTMARSGPSFGKTWKDLDETFSLLVGGSPFWGSRRISFSDVPLAAAFAAKLSRRKGRESTDPGGEACDVILDLVR